MEIRTTLEHLNLIPIDKDRLSDQLIGELSQDNHVLLVCDVSDSIEPDVRMEYIKSLVEAGIIEESQVEAVAEDKSLVIIVPFRTLQVAGETYRRIKHATHFVTMYVDGKPQA